MKNKSILLFAFLFGISLMISNAYSQEEKYPVNNFNIEGVFNCDFNGVYYVRQIGDEILWFGEDDNVNPSWSNVAHGKINGDELIVIWADVPKGSIMQHGKLILKINSNDNFSLISQDGDPFGSSNWVRKP